MFIHLYQVIIFSILCYLFLSVSANSTYPCAKVESVDLTNITVSSDGSITKDGERFPPKYIYNVNISGEIKTFGCPCKEKKCFRKCCPLNKIVYESDCIEMDEHNLIVRYGLNLSTFDIFKRRANISTFGLLYGTPCTVYLEDNKWFVQEDGSLQTKIPDKIPPWHRRGPDSYCVDSFLTESEGVKTANLEALVCFPEDNQTNHYILTSTCMIISCVFILVTVGVYTWLPELRNLHGWVLISCLLSFFVGFSFLATMHILLAINSITADVCVGLTILIYFTMLSAFFWMNVMSFDIWWTFSGKRGMSKGKVTSRYRSYAMYAFGFPTALTILLLSLEFSGLPRSRYLPRIRDQECFLYGTSKLLYLYGPIVILCVANLIFFTLTAIKIASIDRQTAVLKSKESASTHNKHTKDKQRLLLYVKLFAVMGINWIMEVVSSIYPEYQYVWSYTDAYNVLIGFIIFIIFVCKKKIFRMIKKRFNEARGKVSTTHSSSSRTLSSGENVDMGSVKANRQE